MEKAQIATEYLVMTAVLLTIVGVLFLFSLQAAQETVSQNLVGNSLNSLSKTIGEVYSLGPDSQLYAEIELPPSIVNSTVNGKAFGFEVNGLAGSSNLLTEAKTDLVGKLPKEAGRHRVRVRMRSDGKIEIGKGLRISPFNSTLQVFPGETGNIDLIAYNETYDAISLNEFDIHSHFSWIGSITLEQLNGTDIPTNAVLTGDNIIDIASGEEYQFKAVFVADDEATPQTIAEKNYAKTSEGLEAEFGFAITIKQQLTDVDISIGSQAGAAPDPKGHGQETIYFADEWPLPDTVYFQGVPSGAQGSTFNFTVSGNHQGGVPAVIQKGIAVFKITDPNGVEVVNLADQDIPFSYQFPTTISSPIGTYTVYVETNPAYTKNTIIKTGQFTLTEKIQTMKDCFEHEWLNTQFTPPGGEMVLDNWRMTNICSNKTVEISGIEVHVANDLDNMQFMNLMFNAASVWNGPPTGQGSTVLPTRDPGTMQPPYLLTSGQTITVGNKLFADRLFVVNNDGEQYQFVYHFSDGTTETTTLFQAPPANDADCITVNWSGTSFTATQPTGSEFKGFTIANSCEKNVQIVSTVLTLGTNPNTASVTSLLYAGQQAFGPSGIAPPNTTIGAPQHATVLIPPQSSVTSNTVTLSAPINQSGQAITLIFGFGSGSNTYTSPVWSPNFNNQSACLVISHNTTKLWSSTTGMAPPYDMLVDFALTNVCSTTIQVQGVNLMLNPASPATLTTVDLDAGNPASPIEWTMGSPGTWMAFVPMNWLVIAPGQSVLYNDLTYTSALTPVLMSPPLYFTGTIIMGDFSQKTFPPWPQSSMTMANCTRGFTAGTWNATGDTYTGTSINNICDASKPITIASIQVNDGTGGASWKATTVNFGGGATEYYDATGTSPGTNIDITDYTIQGNSSANNNTQQFDISGKSIECMTLTVDLIFSDASQLTGMSIAPSTSTACTGG